MRRDALPFVLLSALALVSLAALVVLISLLRPVHAHEAPSGWQYPYYCCGDQDCGPLPDDQVREVPSGFFLSTGEFIERAKSSFSPDGHYHICRHPNGNIICFFYPPKGM